MPSSTNKLAIFIDGAALYAASKTVGFDIDFQRLLKAYEKRGTLLRALYYTVLIEDQEFSPIRRLTDWLDYNGYTVVSKPAKEFDDGEGRRKFKRNVSMELVVDALELSNHIDHIILFSGDGDFRQLVAAVQKRGVHVTVVSPLSMVADELRRQADVFTDLVDLKSEIGRDPSEHLATRERR
jgi:uncharacterized LabA/DUF88 family protein